VIAREHRERFRFFLKHAGYATPPGRAACALELARAEEDLSSALGYGEASVDWRDDSEPWDEGTEISADDSARRFASGEWTGPYGCIVAIGDDQRPRAVASLWGIVLDSRGTDDPYARVIVAELAVEALEEYRRERDERERAARAGIATAERAS